MTFSRDDLEKAVTHLAFDVQHFRCYVQLFENHRLQTASPAAWQAVIYSLLLHLRLLLDFFYGPPKQDDVWVGHFRSIPQFDQVFPATIQIPTPAEARALSVNLHKRLAHLTATRWEEPAPPMNFYQKYFQAVDALLNSFDAALPADLQKPYHAALNRWEKAHPPTCA